MTYQFCTRFSPPLAFLGRCPLARDCPGPCDVQTGEVKERLIPAEIVRRAWEILGPDRWEEMV